MAGQHRARSVWRSGAAVLAVVAAAAAAFVVSSSTASAAPNTVTSACDSRVAGVNAPYPLSVAQANPASSPCAFDQVSLANANLTIIPGVPLVTGASASLNTVRSETSFSYTPALAVGTAEAQTNVARLLVLAPGLYLQASAIHSQAGVSINANCGGAAQGESWITALTINGSVINVGRQPLTINLGLRISIHLNQTVYNGPHEVTQRALYITFPDPRYSLVVGESHAQLACDNTEPLP
jgi:hypothetical protein